MRLIPVLTVLMASQRSVWMTDFQKHDFVDIKGQIPFKLNKAKRCNEMLWISLLTGYLYNPIIKIVYNEAKLQSKSSSIKWWYTFADIELFQFWVDCMVYVYLTCLKLYSGFGSATATTTTIINTPGGTTGLMTSSSAGALTGNHNTNQVNFKFYCLKCRWTTIKNVTVN